MITHKININIYEHSKKYHGWMIVLVYYMLILIIMHGIFDPNDDWDYSIVGMCVADLQCDDQQKL